MMPDIKELITTEVEGDQIELVTIDGRPAISAYNVGKICEFAKPENEVESRFKAHKDDFPKDSYTFCLKPKVLNSEGKLVSHEKDELFFFFPEGYLHFMYLVPRKLAAKRIRRKSAAVMTIIANEGEYVHPALKAERANLTTNLESRLASIEDNQKALTATCDKFLETLAQLQGAALGALPTGPEIPVRMFVYVEPPHGVAQTEQIRSAVAMLPSEMMREFCKEYEPIWNRGGRNGRVNDFAKIYFERTRPDLLVAIDRFSSGRFRKEYRLLKTDDSVRLIRKCFQHGIEWNWDKKCIPARQSKLWDYIER